LGERNRHRSENDIVASILSVMADRSMKKTRIMYGANLSYTLLMKYLHRLLTCGLVAYVEDRKIYMLTGAGRRFLEEYAELKSLESRLLQYSERFEDKQSALAQMLSAGSDRERLARPI